MSHHDSPHTLYKRSPGALPECVEYRALQKMYTKLQIGIESGLSDVASEVFSRALIPPHVKSVVTNHSSATPGSDKTGVLLDSLLQRTKTLPSTFDDFAESLDAIVSYAYLATDMRALRQKLDEEDRKRTEELEKEAEARSQKKQDLQLSMDSPKLKKALATLRERECSPIATHRRIEERLSIQTPVLVNNQQSPKGFREPKSLSSTPTSYMYDLPPGYMQSSASLNSLTKQSKVVHRNRYKEPVTDPASYEATPTPGRAGRGLSEAVSAIFKVAVAEEANTPTSEGLADNGTSSGSQTSKVPFHTEPVAATTTSQVNKDEESSGNDAPSVHTTGPTPQSSLTNAGLPLPDSADDNELSVLVGLHPPRGSIASLRSVSVESSISACSHDFCTAPSSLTDTDLERHPEQESENVHCVETFVGSSNYYRTDSCETCTKRMLEEASKKLASIQLESERQEAAHKSKEENLLQKLNAEKSKKYELEYTLEVNNQIITELQCNEQVLLADNEHLRKQLTLVEADGYRRVRALEDEQEKVRLLQNELERVRALQNEQRKLLRCPSCNTKY